MHLSTIARFTGVPAAGAPGIVAVLRRHGAPTLGVEGNACVPVESAQGARFDPIDAERWPPGPKRSLAGASFRGARGAIFEPPAKA
ncbi:hypothetical protein [Sorangium sp. So ce385]|uniref:hypothetical protein n=1 Tax=Sorangium sp. So ce385 TaxID=3133308 RepID=UPI003F5B896B